MTVEPGPPFRKFKYYTTQLTPRFELSEERWAVLEPLLFDEPPARRSLSEAYPCFSRLDEEDRVGLIRYCEELDCLHEDLEFALFDLETSQEHSYSDRQLDVDASMYYRRLALVYHADNVDFRVHAYREKVFKLLRHFLGIKSISDRDPSSNDKIRNELSQRGLRAIHGLLSKLRSEATVRAALERRRLFTHQLKERGEWGFLTPGSRVDDDVPAPTPIEKEAARYYDLSVAYDGRWREIDELCDVLARFRYDLVQELQRVGSILK